MTNACMPHLGNCPYICDGCKTLEGYGKCKFILKVLSVARNYYLDYDNVSYFTVFPDDILLAAK